MRTLLRGLAGASLVLGLAALLTGPDGLVAQDKKDAKGKDPKTAPVVPPAKKPEDKAREEAKEKTVGISTSDGLSLNAYWFQGQAADKNPPDAVLMFPPPGSKVTDAWIGLAKAMSEKNFSVLLFDWRGCGMNASDTAGQRILENKELFWKEPYNQRLLEKTSKRTIEDRGLDYRTIVSKIDGNYRYRDFLLNDLLAARFYLDRQNDNRKCNSARIWIVTEKDGGHLGLAFIASEFPRNSIYDPMHDDLGEGRLPGAGRAVENERAEPVGDEHPAEEFALAKEVLLADELGDGAGAHAGGQGSGLSAVGLADVGEDVDGLTPDPETTNQF